MNLFHSVLLKLIDLCCNLNGSFNHKQFCNMIHWSFWKSWSSELWISPNIDTLHYTTSKKCHLYTGTTMFQMTGLEELHGSKVSVTLSELPGYLSNLALKKIVLKKIKKQVWRTAWYPLLSLLRTSEKSKY